MQRNNSLDLYQVRTFKEVLDVETKSHKSPNFQLYSSNKNQIRRFLYRPHVFYAHSYFSAPT